MQRFVYYPGFSVEDPTWLKLAVLYVPTLSPIVPPEGEPFLSDDMRRVRDHTSLIRLHRPTYEDGLAAGRAAMRDIEAMIRTAASQVGAAPESRTVLEWKRPANHQSELFAQKFTYEWADYCVRNGLATRSHYGIRLSAGLAKLYMAKLAQGIADRGRFHAVTDDPALDQASIAVPSGDTRAREMDLARAVVNIKVPRGLAHVPLERVIELRQSPDFLATLGAFHDSLRSSIDLSGSERASHFFRSLRSARTALEDRIEHTFTPASGLISVWLAVAQQEALSAIAATLALAGVTVRTGRGVVRRIRRDDPRRLTRRYLVRVGDLSRRTASQT